eukprot:CAMPEP_0172611036 /NCGR_PEP_ID=MMETSP1068-20121228/30765_1 /TAXON_ID=35684 /ORGANISM="Pseudopedinella elastica, Strain CCMP716" /LENGTH=203 /DNA_ID=CAMNT_0013414897 /DNA_START=532 /DNA_END=1140 /DNA_ORIENTATION=-
MRRVREVVDPRRRIFTFTMIREPISRAVSFYFFGTPIIKGKPVCQKFLPGPVCKHGIGVLGTSVCVPSEKCWPPMSTATKRGCSPDVGPLAGELLKYYFSSDCQSQDAHSGALEVALETLHGIDVVGLTEEQDASFCLLFWVWNFTDIFWKYCGKDKHIPESHQNPSRKHDGISEEALNNYSRAVPEDFEIYHKGAEKFIRDI